MLRDFIPGSGMTLNTDLARFLHSLHVCNVMRDSLPKVLGRIMWFI